MQRVLTIPERPKFAIRIWAQTRHDAPGKQEPEWGEEQPNIAFNHYLKGIDIDIRGHAGAIGSALFSVARIVSARLHGACRRCAVAGFSDCPGQGGGTYNITTIGGRYGITLDAASRFPLLTGCKFVDQTVACIGYHSPTQVPTLLVGCQLAPASELAIDMDQHASYAGVNLVDCRIVTQPDGVVVKTRRTENIHLENCCVKGAATIATGGSRLPWEDNWIRIERYSSSAPQGIHLLNGVASTGIVERYESVHEAADFETLRAKHYRPVPCVDAPDVVNVKECGARGDGQADDTDAFRKAIAASDKVFVPRGTFLLSANDWLRANTHLFGLTSTHTHLGHRPNRIERRSMQDAAFSILTVDDPNAAPGFSHLGVHGDVKWRSGNGTMMLAGRFPRWVSGHGGGRFYGVRGIGRQNVMRGLRNPISLYAFNIERVGTNPQSLFMDCQHLRIFYFKVEAGTLNRGGDANTPSAFESCQDVRVHCMYGNVRRLQDRPMLRIVESDDIVVSQFERFSVEQLPPSD